MVLTCSTRPGAAGPLIADWAMKALQPAATALGVHLRPVSLAELGLPLLDEEEHPSTGIYRQRHTRDWSALVDAADGFIVVTPEYNYGMPATLKNALDYLGREWAWKPMGFVSYGNTSAGTRSVQHAKQVVTTLRLVPLGATVALRLTDAMTQTGAVRDDPSLTAAADGMLSELTRVAHALRPLRELGRDDAVTGPVPGSYVRPLTPDDAPQMVVLQRCCWVDEALANSTLSLAPLQEGTHDVRAWLEDWSALGLWRDGRLLGMVRTRTDGGVGHIGRLAVVPDQRGAGVGRWLLGLAETRLASGCARLELSTGAQSKDNIRFYESAGFAQGGDATDGVIHLSKSLVDARTPTLT